MASSSDALNEFGLEVLRALRRDKLAPLPEYFELYFNEILQTKPQDLRKEIAEQAKYGYNKDSSAQIVNLESKLTEHSKAIKELLNSIANVHKQLNRSFQIFNKHVIDAANLTSPSAAQNLAGMLKNDAAGLSQFLAGQSETFKAIYQKSSELLNSVEEESIFDLQYGVFNKRYFIAQATHEQKRIKFLGHISTIVTIRPSRSLEIPNDKAQILINKTIAKLLMRNARRSDVVAYLEDNTFAILLRHKDVPSAAKACERYSDILLDANFFMGDREIELRVHSGVSALNDNTLIDEIVSRTIAKMEHADVKEVSVMIEEPKQVKPTK